MRSPHQLFQTVLLYVTSTLQHVVYINIPKRRLCICVPNIVTLHALNFIISQLREAFTLELTVYQIQMVEWCNLKRWRLVLIDVKISRWEWINHTLTYLVTIEFWYCHLGRCSCQTIIQTIAEPVLLHVLLLPEISAEFIHWPRHQLFFNLLFKYIVLLLLSYRFYRTDLIYVLVMDELALFAVGAHSGCLLMPLLAHLGLVVFIEALGRGLDDQLSIAVSVSTILIEFTWTTFHEIPTQLRLVIELEVLDVSQHLLARLKMHLLLLPRLLFTGHAIKSQCCLMPGGNIVVAKQHFFGIFHGHLLRILLLNISPDVVPEWVLNRGMIIATI